MKDIFGSGSVVAQRVYTDYSKLKKVVDACRIIGKKVAATVGTWDLIHEGHMAYLEMGKRLADEHDVDNVVLVVGVDSDGLIHKTKGPHRPIVGQDERIRVLCHVRHVNLVKLIGPREPLWELARSIRPDVFFVSERNGHSDEEIAKLKEFCGQVAMLPSQSETSTTAKIRLIHVKFAERFKKEYGEFARSIKERLDSFEASINEFAGD